MNETAIQNALWSKLQQKGHSLVVPNYTPAKWWECDVFSLTKAGMMVEHEIKLTVADFKADAQKLQKRFIRTPGGKWHEGQEVINKKRERLALADPNGPTRFFYVVPEGLLKAEDVPVWAGLLTASYDQYKIVRLCQEKEAPKLHTQPCAESVAKHALGVMYWRYWHLRTRMKPEHVESFEWDEPAAAATEPKEGG